APSSFRALFRKTGGWASGLILFCHAARGKKSSEIESLLHHINGSHKYVFSYLEENIYGALPDDIRKFLVETSILPRLSPGLCDAFMGIENSRQILERLENGHLFTISLDEESDAWLYHQLFREFLGTRLKHKYTEEAARELHARAARALEKDGDEEGALAHFLKAGRMRRARRLLRKLAKPLFRDGRARLIRSYLDAMPGESSRTEPWGRYLRACSLELAGKFPEAVHEVKKALDLFRQTNDETGMEHCVLDLARYDSLNGDFRRAEKSLRELLARPGFRGVNRFEAQGYWILFASSCGEMETADRHFDEGMAQSAEIEDETFRTFTRTRLMYA
ncbi:MAG: hypothetical protein GY859_26500, partial [Desulfobacterales bacterium]|nr:hypothetical protein [Desulfobacterales bacterium]